MILGALQFAPSSEKETAICAWNEAAVGLKNWLKGVQVTYTRFLKGPAGKESTPRKGLPLNKFGPKPVCLGVMAAYSGLMAAFLLQGATHSLECDAPMLGPVTLPP